MGLKTNVGLFFMIGFVLLAAMTFMVEDMGDMFTAKGYKLQVRLKEADVEPGSPVKLAGVKIGTVKRLRILSPQEASKGDGDPAKPVLVTLSIQQDQVVYDSYVAKVVSSGLLGKGVLALEMGKVTDESVLLKHGDMLPKSGETVSLDAVLAKAKKVAEDISAVTAKIRAGEGTVGRLIMAEEVYDDIKGGVRSFRATCDNASTITAAISEGRGTIGRLVRDEDLGQRVDSAVTEFRDTFAGADEAIKDARAGRGTVGKLLTDEEMASDAKEAVGNAKKAFAGIDGVTQDIKAGKGTLGRLASDEELAEDVSQGLKEFRKAGDNLAAITGQVRSGQGTVGKLIYDDKLIKTAQEILDSIQAALEDLRESAPVASFAGAVLGAF